MTDKNNESKQLNLIENSDQDIPCCPFCKKLMHFIESSYFDGNSIKQSLVCDCSNIVVYIHHLL